MTDPANEPPVNSADRCPTCGRYEGDAPMARDGARGCPRCGMWIPEVADG